MFSQPPMEPCGFLSFHQNPASTSDLPLGPGAEVADGLWTCPATLKFGSFEPQLLLDRDMAREEERQQLAAYCRASLGPSLLGWSGLEIPTLQLLDESKRRRAMFLESECRNRQLKKQCDALNTKVQVLTDIKADQATELRRLSAKTTKLQQVAEQQSRSLEEAQANISALARELAASKQQLCLTQQSAAEGAEAAARANASLTEALASAQQQLVDSQEQAQQAAQAVEAAAYSTLVACRDRHYQQLAAQLSEHKAELQQQTGLAAAAAAADREAAAARAQEAASCIAELQAAVQVRGWPAAPDPATRRGLAAAGRGLAGRHLRASGRGWAGSELAGDAQPAADACGIPTCGILAAGAHGSQDRCCGLHLQAHPSSNSCLLQPGTSISSLPVEMGSRQAAFASCPLCADGHAWGPVHSSCIVRECTRIVHAQVHTTGTSATRMSRVCMLPWRPTGLSLMPVVTSFRMQCTVSNNRLSG